MKKATLHIMQGFIAAGKSTYAQKLAMKEGAVYLNPDIWVIEHFSAENYMQNWNKCFSEAVNTLWEETKEHLSAGIDVIFDMGFWLRKDRDYAKMIAKKYNADFKHYYIYAPDEVLKQRIIETRPQEWAEQHLRNFNENKNKFQEPEEDENPIIINSY